MAWKFLNIGKANAEIERLESEVASLKSAAGKTTPAPTPEQTASLELKIEELGATVSALGDRISALEKAAGETASNFKVEIARLDKSFSDFQTNAKELATRMAGEITARQGQPPLATAGTASSAAGDDLETTIKNTTDPLERTRIFRKNRSAILAKAEAQKR